MSKFLHIPPKSDTDEVWTMKDGRKIAVCDMSETHVRNTLRMILRRARKQQEDLAGADQSIVKSVLKKVFEA